jgi:inosine/xanthosine triphosphatase
MLFPGTEFVYEALATNSGVRDQPMSCDEMRTGALGRVAHARTLVPDADFYVGLEGGAEQLYGDLFNFGWVIIESKTGKRGQSRTSAFALPPAIVRLMLEEGMEQSPAMDIVLGKQDTKLSTGTIGPLTNDTLTYTDWYVHAVVSALVPFLKEEFYPHNGDDV